MKKQLLFLSFSMFMTTNMLPAAQKNDPSLSPLALKLKIERLQATMDSDKVYGPYKLGLSQLAHPSEYFIDKTNTHGFSDWCNFYLINPYKDVNKEAHNIHNQLQNMPSWFNKQEIERWLNGIKENTNQSIELLEDYKNFILEPHTPEETNTKIESLQKELSHHNKLINQKIVAIDRNFWDQSCKQLSSSN